MIHSARFRRKQKAAAMPRVTLTPLIDTALVLLVIFMVTTPLIKNSLKIELPQGAMSEVDTTQPQEWTVEIDSAGIMYLDGEALDAVTLLTRLEGAARTGTVDSVMVEADKGASYGNVVELVDAIKNIGKIQYVALATHKPRAT